MNVTKKDGKLVEFDLSKIKSTIIKAFEDSSIQYADDIIELLALRVSSNISKKARFDKIITTDIYNAIIQTLNETGYIEVADSFSQFAKNRSEKRCELENKLDYKRLVESYTKKADWRVKENSTVTYSVGGLILSNSGAITANYWLSEIYDEEIAEAHRNADIHIHDLSMLTGYCAGWSLKQLIKEGLGGVPGKITSSPASHLSTLCNQMVNFLGIMQNEWAGAQAFSSFDTYLAPFIKVDNLSYKEVKQCIQSFVFGVNTPSRWGTQAPFSNITLDWTVPKDLARLPAIVGGKEQDFTYGDCKAEMDMINKAFIETMIEGDANGRGFQYPIPTYSITRDFDWSETENNKLLFEMTARYGTPYFSNYINSDMEPSDVRSMCPLAGDTKITWYSGKKGRFYLSNIKDVYHNNCEDISVISNGKLVPAKINKFEIPADYKITLSNGATITTTANHLNKVLNKPYTETKDLVIGDYLPISRAKFSLSNNLTYELGKFVGAYLGDGSSDGGQGVTYSLNPDTDQDLIDWLCEYGPKCFGKSFTVSACPPDKHCVSVRIYSHMLTGLIREFCEGTNALDKRLSMKAIAQSEAFRNGILDGYLATDGSHSASSTKEVIYTASSEMIASMQSLCGSLGIPTDLKIYRNESKKIMFGDTEYNCSGESYYLGLYRDCARSKYGSKYILDDDYMWFSITSIEHLKKGVGGATKNSYCVEILSDDEPVFMLGNGVYTHNCRLRLDLRELRKKSGGFFGSGESTGSVGVVTINMPRLAYLAADEKDFYHRLDHMMDISARSLKTKRTIISRMLNEGLYPYTKHYLGNFDNHFSTIGLVGMNEACLNANWIRKDLTDEKAQAFTRDVLNHMRERLSDYQEEYGDLYNLEATPAESTSYRLAKHDVERFPDIITASSDCNSPYYTNSSHLPVSFTDDIFTALDIQDDLQTLYTSGTVFHAFLGEKLPSWQAAASLVRKIAENYKLPYYTMSPTYSICKNHGYLVGEQYTCPECGEATEVYSRITGYYRPVQNWNVGKTQEFKERKLYDIANSKLTHTSVISDSNLSDKNNQANGEVATNINHQELKEDIDLTDINALLFATSTCPNCKIAAAILDQAGIQYTKVFANENIELAKKYEVKQAPTLFVFSSDSEYCKYAGVGEIREFIKKAKESR